MDDETSLNSFVDEIVAQALMEASEILSQAAETERTSMVEDVTESNCTDKENGAFTTATPAELPSAAPLKKVDVKDLEQTVDSLNRKVQELLAQSQAKPYSASNASRVPLEPLGRTKINDHSAFAESEMRITDHITSMVDRLQHEGSKSANRDVPAYTNTADDAEYQELASRVQKIFQREATQKLSSSFGLSPNASFNFSTGMDKSGVSSYFVKGGPDASFAWNERSMTSFGDAATDDCVTRTHTTVESSHPDSVDAATPRNLPNESIGSWTPRRHLVKEPHTSGIYSRSRESLHDVSTSPERMHNYSSYSHDFTLNSSKAFITQDDSVIDDETDTTRVANTIALEGSLMSVVTESCNSSFFRDMNDSLYSPERDLRRAALRKSPSRKREKMRRSREDLSLCYDLDTTIDNNASQISSKPLSHYYPSSKSLVEKAFVNLNETQPLETDKLHRMWANYRKNGVHKRGRNPSNKDSDCLSQLICNPVQYFTQQWIEGVHKKNISMSMTFESESNSSWNGKVGMGQSTTTSWKSKRANDVQPPVRGVAFNEANSKRMPTNVKVDSFRPKHIEDKIADQKSQKQKRDRNKADFDVAEVEVEEAKCRTVSVQTPRELLLGLPREYFDSDNCKADISCNDPERVPLSKMSTLSFQSENQKRREIAALKQNEPKNENTLSWFHSLSDKENDGVRQTYQEKSMPKGTSNLTLQDAFLLNKADMVRKSRARLRGISIRAAERHMQQVYEQKKKSDSRYLGYPSKEAVQSRDSPRWASVVPVKDCNDSRKKPITKTEMRNRTERLYQSLPEVKERERLNKQRGQIHTNKIMLDSYKAKLKDQQRSKVNSSRSKTLVVRHY